MLGFNASDVNRHGTETPDRRAKWTLFGRSAVAGYGREGHGSADTRLVRGAWTRPDGALREVAISLQSSKAP